MKAGVHLSVLLMVKTVRSRHEGRQRQNSQQQAMTPLQVELARNLKLAALALALM